MTRVLLGLIAVACAFGGQSLSNTSVSAKNDSFPSHGQGNAVRVEFYLHDWPSSPSSQSGYVVLSHALGFWAQYLGNGHLFVGSYWSSEGSSFNIDLTTLPTSGVYVRWQHDPTAHTESVEAWDTNGVRVMYSTLPAHSTSDTDGGIAAGGASTGLAFFRVHSTLVALNSRPPVTSDNANTVLNWKLDGNLADSSGNGWTAVSYTGAAVNYMATPNQGVVAKIKTAGSPAWSDWSSLRAGKDNQLDGTASYSQSDTSATVTYSWLKTAGGTVLWDSTLNQSSATPVVRGLVFGTYTFGLTVTDGTSTNSTSLTVGAVATDDNYVVVNADPNVDKIFGPMMAFGHGPWGYMDERAMSATKLRAAAYTSQGLNPPSWKVPFAGTVAYRFNGDTDFNGRGTTLASSTTTTATTLSVTDATLLDFTDLPTRLLLAPNYGAAMWYSNAEEVRICSVSGNTLTVCSGGRANHGTATAWPSGTKVGQLKIKGSGTSFLSTICASAYAGYDVALHYTRPDTSDGQMTQPVSGCESDTTLYLSWVAHDVGTLNNQVFSGVQYGAANFPSYVGQYGANFYGEDLAHRALYYRSGWTPARDAANVMSSQYVSSPYVSGGDGLGWSPLYYGGGAIAAIAGAVLDSSSGVNWADLRGLASKSAPNADVTSGYGACNGYDTRDNGYALGIIALMAAFDPSPSSRATWAAAVQQAWTREQTCKGTDNSWANSGFKWTTGQFPVMTMTNGSATVTGTGFPTGMCGGVASGSMTVTNGSASATGTGFVSGAKIAIVGTRGGQPFHAWYRYQLNSSTSITMSVLWPGDSGTVSYLIESDADQTTIGSNTDDAQLQKNWSCTWNSSTLLTLNRPWDGPSGSGYYMYRSNLVGFNQQPYMLGIKQKEFEWNALSDTSHDWHGLSGLLGGWLYSTGFDQVTKGLYYGRVLEACEPATTPPTSPLFDDRVFNCSLGLNAATVRQARVLNAEGMSGLVAYYNAAPDSTRKAQIDEAFGSVWGNPAMTTGGVATPSDGYYVIDENSDLSLAAYKWTGFFFGMGMAHQWPAARLGGVMAAQIYATYLGHHLGSVSGATVAAVTVTAPSGAVTTTTCTGQCYFTIDRRQGDHWAQVSYLDSMGATVSQDPAVLVSGSVGAGSLGVGLSGRSVFSGRAVLR